MIDEIDKRVIEALQHDFPLCETPFAMIAERAGMSEKEAIARIRRMQDSGIIRKVGAFVDASRLNYASVLLAADVPAVRIDEVAAIINDYKGVTHNYIREGTPNLWFTLTAPSSDALESQLKSLEQQTGMTFIRLPKTKEFKLGVTFAFS